MKISVKKVLLWCVALGAIIVWALLPDPRDPVEVALEEARAQLQAGDYTQAELTINSILQQDIRSAEGTWLLAQLHYRQGDNVGARKELERALELGWSRDQIVPLLAQVLLMLNEYFEVANLSPQGLGHEAETSLTITKALAALEQGDFRRAEEELDAALIAAPDSLEVQIIESRLMSARGEAPEALTAAEEILRSAPDEHRVAVLVADLRARTGDSSGAIDGYSNALEQQPSDYTSLLKRALLYLKQENYAAAEADAQQLLRALPDSPAGQYVQGLVHYLNQKPAEAIAALQKVEPAAEEYPHSYFLLGSAYLQQGDVERAAEAARRYHAMQPDSVRGRKLLAVIYLQQGNNEGAGELLQPVLAKQPDDIEALNLLANARLRAGRVDEGLGYLLQVAQLQPDSPVAHLQLGAGLLLGGRREDALREFDLAVELDPDFQQAEVMLVLGRLAADDGEAAIDAAQAFQERHPDSTMPLNLLGRVYLELDRSTDARQAFKQALALDEADPAANLNLAYLAHREGDIESARKHYQIILTHHQDDLPALIGLAQLEQEQGQLGTMRTLLQQAIKAHPEDLQPRLLLGRHYFTSSQPIKALALFPENLGSRAPETLLLVAQAQIAASRFEDALATLEQLGQFIDTPQLHHLRAMALASSPARMESELRLALAIDGNYLPSRTALARYTLLSGRQEEFEQHLARLNALAPQNPEVLLLRAAAQQRSGNTGEAMQLARQAHEQQATAASVKALGALEIATGNADAANTLFRDWLAVHRGDVGVRMSLAHNLQQQGDTEAATAAYMEVVQRDPDNIAALNNLAWLNREIAPDEALQYAQRAASLAPESAAVLDTLAMVQYHGGAPKDARAIIDRAVALNPGNPSQRYHQAMIYTAVGDEEEALLILQTLVRDGQAFAEMAAAQTLLEDLQKP